MSWIHTPMNIRPRRTALQVRKDEVKRRRAKKARTCLGQLDVLAEKLYTALEQTPTAVTQFLTVLDILNVTSTSILFRSIVDARKISLNLQPFYLQVEDAIDIATRWKLEGLRIYTHHSSMEMQNSVIKDVCIDHTHLRDRCRLELVRLSKHTRNLQIIGCSNLSVVKLPRSWELSMHNSALQTVHITGCSDLVDISGMSRCDNLQVVTLKDCLLVQNVEEVVRTCISITELHLENMPSITSLDGLLEHPSLVKAAFLRCRQLSGLPVLQRLISLEIRDCCNIVDFQFLETYYALQRLTIAHQRTTYNLAAGLVPISGALCQLQIYHCGVTKLAYMKALMGLVLVDCKGLRSIQCFQECEHLTSASIISCNEVDREEKDMLDGIIASRQSERFREQLRN
jgi:hypothetical protein